MIHFPGALPITIHPIFWAMAVAIGWLNSETVYGTALWTIVIVISVLIHELGHATSAILFGQKAKISLVGLGGMTEREGAKLSHWKEFIIVLCGPLAGFLLFLAALEIQSFFNPQNPTLQYFLTITIYANLFWTVVNLFPVQPLDGGHLLSIFLQSLFGHRGIKMAFFVSMILALILSIGFLLIHAIIASALFLLFTFESYRMWKNSLAITQDDRNADLQNLLKHGEEALEQGRSEEAKTLFEQIMQASKEGMIYSTAVQYLAKIWDEEGNAAKAYDLLKPLKKTLPLENLAYLQQLAYRLDNWQEAIKIGEVLHREYPHYEIALINALSHARLKEAQPAAGWLQCAFNEGLPNREHIFFDHAWDTIRDSPFFQKLLDSQ